MEKAPEPPVEFPGPSSLVNLADVVGPSFIVSTIGVNRPSWINGIPHWFRTSFVDASRDPVGVFAAVFHQRADTAIEYHHNTVKSFSSLSRSITAPLIAKLAAVEKERGLLKEALAKSQRNSLRRRALGLTPMMR